jgi:hypothetical protein
MGKPKGRPKGRGNAPQELRDKVRLLLYQDDKLTGKELQDGLDKTYSVRTYQALKDAEMPRAQRMRENQLDKPWHLHCTPDLPAEAIARILEVQQATPKFIVLPPSLRDPTSEYSVVLEGNRHTAIPKAMTVREAKWVARLYAVRNLKSTITLMHAAHMYALAEILTEIGTGNHTLDTTHLDAIIMGKDVETSLSEYFMGLGKPEWLGLVQAYVNRITNGEVSK